MTDITIKPSLSNINVVDIVIQNETHSCAAPIVERMNSDPACLFAAYKIEHPSENFVSVRVQGNENKNARAIFKESVESIISDLDDVLKQLRRIKD